MSELLTYIIIGIMIYISVFAIVERICKCCEQCALYKSYGAYLASTGEKPEEIIKRLNDAMK